ncbi:hypothetical protein HOY82DRAFT_555630 [Tuber indicum]|nr:hypothetical protein HOY82DRAFT_555630 [Tuber indicum]
MLISFVGLCCLLFSLFSLFFPPRSSCSSCMFIDLSLFTAFWSRVSCPNSLSTLLCYTLSRIYDSYPNHYPRIYYYYYYPFVAHCCMYT